MDRRGAASNGKTLSPMWNSRTEISSPLFSLLSLEREIQTIFLFLSSASFLLSPSTFLKEVEICRRVYERNFDWNDSIFVEDERENEKFTGADLWVD